MFKSLHLLIHQLHNAALGAIPQPKQSVYSAVTSQGIPHNRRRRKKYGKRNGVNNSFRRAR